MTSAQRLAYHEAGHLVVAVEQGLALPGEGLALAVNTVQGSGWIECQAPQRAYLRREVRLARPSDPKRLGEEMGVAAAVVLVALAGPLAEAKFCGSFRREGARDDLRLAVELLDLLSMDRAEAERRMGFARKGAADLVAEHRAAIERVATAALSVPYGGLCTADVLRLVRGAA